MGSRFVTIAHEGKSIVREKMSRFLAFALPASSAEEAKSIIADFTNRYHDARHVCWAYMTGADRPNTSQATTADHPARPANRFSAK